MSIENFHHDERGYAAWFEANPDAFVFNNFGGRFSDDNVVHRASCVYLRQPRHEGRRTNIEKFCSDDLDGLIAVADRIRASAGGWKLCGRCNPI